MRLSRGRVLLRVVLLVVGGAFMLQRACATLRDARVTVGGGGLLGRRLALVWGLVGVLALVTAGSAAWSLLGHPRRRTLRLDDVTRAGAGADAPRGASERGPRPDQ